MAFEGLSEKLNGVFKRLKSRGKLSEADVKEAMREVKMALLEADVSYKVVKDFIAKVTERSVGEEVLKSLTPGQQVIKIVNDELIKLMGEANSKINFPNKPPCIIMMCGLQGSGKTTHAAKLAKMFKKEGKRPLLIAADVYRPAAIEQLKVVGERAEVAVFEMGQIDPRKIVKEGIKHAKDYGNDLVIIDTAGRLHIDEELMNELKDIKKIAEPNEIMLVVDAMIGQDAVKVASSFDEALGIDSVILTKLDSDTRGGAALSVLAVTGKPIKFVGMGEKLDEFEAFHPERMASRILGMGDMLTLIEKATQTVDEKDAKKLAEKMQEKGFDLNDLLEQMKQIQKMGSMKSIIRMLPGANKVTDEQVEQGEVQLKKTEAMINSMTRAEREKPAIIDPKRKRRIAAGSGTQVSDVNQLLKQFEQMQKMMKQFGIGGNLHGKKSRRNRAALLKGLGGGMPIGAICATAEVAKAFTPGSHGTTFGGHPVSCAAALAEVNELIDRDLAGNAKKVGDYFAEKLAKLPHVKEVRHQGLLVGVEFDDTISGVEVKHGCLDRHLLITAIGAHIIRLIPPLIVTGEDCDKAVAIIEETVKALEK